MSAVSISQGGNHYCPSCKINFAALPTVRGDKEVICCPICRKEISSSEGVTSLGGNNYRCNKCNLLFGKVAKEGEVVKCPICPISQSEKGG